MLKKALIVAIGAIGLLGAVALMFRNPEAVRSSAAQPWPGEMGALKAADAHWPPQHANEASMKLKALGDKLGRDQNINDFVSREITRAEVTIGEPPWTPDLSAIRDLLLHEKVIWERYDSIGESKAVTMRVMHMTMARALVANALKKAHANDVTAWDDLEAVWRLALSLEGHPQMMMQTAALTMARMINAVAWKMPLPVPAWFDELQARDNVQLLLNSFQFQTASYWKSDAWIFPTKSMAAYIEHDRAIAERLFKLTNCDVTTETNELGVDVSSIWRRAFRYRAEREATANALRIREGKPIETTSRCSDGGWTFDGSTLRFSREIATSVPDTPMPLVLQVKK